MKTRILGVLGALGILLALPSAAKADSSVPQITSCVSARGSMTLTWTGPEAPYYEICRAARRNGVYVRIGQTAATTYTDTGLQQNAVYFYRVRPCDRAGTPVGDFSAPAGQCCVALIAAPATENPCYRQGRTITVRGLMLHSVGCPQEKGAVFAALWNQPTADVLVHAVIEPGGSVYQLADWNLRCWHCGGSGNNTLIGVEMTEPNELIYESGATFTWSGSAQKKAVSNYNTAVALFASLCFTYKLNPLTDIYSHNEGGKAGFASGHADPEHLWTGLGLSLTMDGFRQDVADKMAGLYRERTVPAVSLAQVTVQAEALNVRSGPGTDYEILDTLEAGRQETVTTVLQQPDGEWGCLSSGGWIALRYVKA